LLGLDKWIKPEKEKKDSEKKPEVKNDVSNIKKPEFTNLSKKTKAAPKSPEEPSIKFTKFLFICPNAKCKYQKTIMKKKLIDKDKRCPRCKSEMKIKKK